MHKRSLLPFLQYLHVLARNTVHGLSLVDCLISQPSSISRKRDNLLAIKVGHNVLHTLEPGVGTVLFDPVIELAIHHFQGSGVATGNGRVSKGEESGAYAGTNEVTKSHAAQSCTSVNKHRLNTKDQLTGVSFKASKVTSTKEQSQKRRGHRGEGRPKSALTTERKVAGPGQRKGAGRSGVGWLGVE